MKKPIPTPGRLSCGFCGYSAPEPEYKHICSSGIILSICLIAIPVSLISIIIYKFLMYYY